jgi:type I restriction enzyme, S subunit
VRNSYPSYRDSGVEWIGKIPGHWNKKRLKHLVLYKNGYSFSSDDFSFEGQVAVIRIGDINDKIDFDKCIKLPMSFLEKFSGFIVKKNDVLVALTGATIGKSCKYNYDKPSLLNQRVCLLKNNNELLDQYLYYYVKSEIFIIYILYNCYGGGQDNIGREEILNMIITHPPLPEQKQIANFLDYKTELIDILIDKTKKKIELLKEKRTALINHCATKGLNPDVEMKDSGIEWIGKIPKHWGLSKLKFKINGIKDGTHGSFKRIDDGFPLLSSKNVHYDGIRINENESHISHEDHLGIIRNGYPAKGDILITIVGTIGRSCVYELNKPLSFQRSVCFLRPNESLNPYFLHYCSISNFFLIQLENYINKSAQGGVYLGNLKEIIIPSISLEEEHEIVNFLDEQTQKIDNIIEKENNRIELLKEYRKSLISEVVTGKIDVRDEVVA